MTCNTWIIGPCAVESKESYFSIAKTLNTIFKGKDWYYKASFDKANRTSITGKRGIGLNDSIEYFKDIKKEYPNIKLTTDIHEPYQAEKLVDYIDCIQIPSFLCRQSDLIIEAARHFKIVNIKKMQCLGPANVIKSLDKIKSVDPNTQAWICERGSNFGYNELIVNFNIVDELKRHYDKVILDCTHSTQRSRAVYKVQGDRILAERYLLAASIFDYDGIFAETHPNPLEAASDRDSQIYLDRIKGLVKQQERIKQINEKNHT